jgi:hypothetical protein
VKELRPSTPLDDETWTSMLWNRQMMKRLWVLGLIVMLDPKTVCAQACPSEDESGPGIPSTLHGKLLYHEDLRTWHEIKLSQKVCNWESIQVISTKLDWNYVHRFRGCAVTITGRLFTPVTGYYSLGLAMDAGKIQPDDDCKPFPIQPDLSKVPIPKTVQQYIVTISVDYRNGGHIDVKVGSTAKGKIALKPWQAYAGYHLTGAADVIWFDCAKGFEMIKADQIPKMNREISPSAPGDNYTGFDEDNGLNTLVFECRRTRQ